jgi:lantibiotic modifying enzyme
MLMVNRLVPAAALPAANLGVSLIAAGRPGRRGLRWPTTTAFGLRAGLTGMSHGAAGIGLALAELAADTGDDRFRSAAVAAFDFERGYFDPAHANWADLRGPGGARIGGRWRTYAPFWCHGAAGIALSRLLSATAGLPGCADEASHGLRTTTDWLEYAVGGDEPVVLCHGMAGNAEVLRLAARTDLLSTEVEPVVRAVEVEICRRFSGPLVTWPCRAAAGLMVPGLMCGLAGVGHFLLRAAAPGLPTILAPVLREGIHPPGRGT